MKRTIYLLSLTSLIFGACGPAGQLGRAADPEDLSGENGPADQVRGDGPTSIATWRDDSSALPRGGIVDLEVRPVPAPPPLDEDVLSHLPTGAAQLSTLCARGLDNPVTQAFCSTSPPAIGSLVDLQTTLGVAFQNRENGNGNNGNPAFAITGHSSSLVTRSVSAINPRTIVFTRNRNARPDRHLLALGFTRGDQFAEIAVVPPTGDPTFYLLRFTLGCSGEQAGCNWADRLTPATEVGWASWSLYQDEDLKNSVVDCLQCHQPDGPGTPKLLRMQELRNPWTHWFRDNRDGGRALLLDFHAAHGTDEDYGGVPAALIDDSDPARLEDLIEVAGFEEQPNLFRTSNIEDEVVDSSPMQPELNVPAGQSATWETLYANAVSARAIPPPYHDVKVTDPIELANMTAAYVGVMNGALPPEALPDIRDVFLAEALPQMSMRPAAGLDGDGILLHMCGQCHNGRLDQSITRARFDATSLASMSRAEKDEAIRRLTLPEKSRYKMPPKQFRELSDRERHLAVEALRR